MYEKITFADAITVTQNLITQLETQQIDQATLETQLTCLLKTRDGARGFFVAYLTDQRSLADSPIPSIMNALKNSEETISDLLVKNLVMSTAMMITHERNHDQEAVQGSERVQCRSLALIKSLESIAVNEKVQLMYHSLDTHTGEYQDFLERYGYDEPQKAVMKKILLTLLTNQK